MTRVPPAVNQLAQTVLTPAQYRAWHLYETGHSQRAIAYALNISRSAVIDRLDNAGRTLKANGVRMDGAGNYYLEESA